MTTNWDNSFELARQLASAPSAAPWLELLREAQPKWEGKVGVKPTIVDYLIFHRLDEGHLHPWEQFVAVSYTRKGVMEFRLQVTTTDRATPENAYAVLDGFLMRLTGTTEAAPSS